MSAKIVVLWLIVGLPLAVGVEQTLTSVVKLFQ
jgi:hypothetical protein